MELPPLAPILFFSDVPEIENYLPEIKTALLKNGKGNIYQPNEGLVAEVLAFIYLGIQEYHNEIMIYQS